MKNVKQIAKWMLVCILAVLMTGIVSAAEAAEEGEISSFNNYGENGNYQSIGEYEVAYGSTLTDVTRKLPSTLTAKLTTGEEVEVPVTWVCVSDNLGGNTYLPKHEDVSAVYTFEAQLGEAYKMAANLPDDYVMPFATVSYTEDAQELNSQVPESESILDSDMDAAGMSAWTWIIWMIVIVIVVVVLWWLFAGNKNGKEK